MIWVVPPPSNSGNEGLGWDSLLKMFHNPGGDWNPGRGDNPINDQVQIIWLRKTYIQTNPRCI